MTITFTSGNSAASIPRQPATGELYYDIGRIAMMVFNGSSWVEVKARAIPLAPSLEYPYAVACHRHDDREIEGRYEHMPLEPCERWLFNQGLIQNQDFSSYYDFVFDGENDYRLTVRFKDPDLAAMFKTVWGGERVKR